MLTDTEYFRVWINSLLLCFFIFKVFRLRSFCKQFSCANCFIELKSDFLFETKLGIVKLILNINGDGYNFNDKDCALNR